MIQWFTMKHAYNVIAVVCFILAAVAAIWAWQLTPAVVQETLKALAVFAGAVFLGAIGWTYWKA